MLIIGSTVVFGIILWIIPMIVKYLQAVWDSHILWKLKKSKLQAKVMRKSIKLDYDPQDCPTYHRFQLLSKQSNCLFAKTANLWGCLEYNETLSLEENVKKLIPSLLKFITLADEGERLDGYIIEIKGEKYCSNVSSFASTVKQTLEIIASHDPSGINIMKFKGISSSSWYFSFCNAPIFVTTFAPFYTSSHCRYMHSIPELANTCYILLQPEISFLHNNVGEDTPHTNWENPQTIRDRIRCSFRKHQREYYIPPTNRYPIAEMIVLHPNSTKEELIPIKLWEA